MRKIVNLSLANIRKGKGQAVSLLAFVVIAVTLLNLGLLLMLRFGDFFDKKFDDTNSAHFSVLIEDEFYQSQKGELTAYLKNYKGVTETEDSEILFFMGDINFNNGKMPGYLIFTNADNRQKMNPYKLMEGKAPKQDDEICLPYAFKAGGGYKTGDSFTIANKGARYSFTISGFSEEIMFGSGVSTARIYLSDSGYGKMLSGDFLAKYRLLAARMEHPADGDKLSIDFAKENFNINQTSFHSTYSSIKGARTGFSGMISMIFVIFAVLIVLINLIVISFRIRNSIEEGITNIGALKAIGYKSAQIVDGINLQFGAIAALGTVLGIALSYMALPAVSFVLQQQTALVWAQGFDLSVSLITVLALLASVLIITFLSSKNIKRINPLTALRQGLSSHSFKRNHFPLDTSKGPLSLLIALKAALQSKGQMIMIFIIIFAISFTAAAGVSVYYNVGINPEKFVQLMVGEMPNCAFFVNDSKDSETVMERIKNKSETRKAIYFDDATVMIDDVRIRNTITDDFSLLEGSMLYQGQYPKYNNEIVISGNVSDYSGKNIDDTVSVLYGGKTENYIVVGLVQSSSDVFCMMTADGIKRLNPDFERNMIYVYLNDSTKTADFIKEIERESGDVFSSTVNLYEFIDAQIGAFASIFGMATTVIVVVTILVIMLVLYLVLKTVIIRRKRTLGIQKALGFTTWQIMNQLSLHCVPVIALAVAAGGIVGATQFNGVFIALTRSAGLRTASMPVPIGMTIVMCIGLVLISYAISMLISWRIRKISAYELITE